MSEPRLSLAFVQQCRMLAAARERGVQPPPAITQGPLVDWEPEGCGEGSMTSYMDEVWRDAIAYEIEAFYRDAIEDVRQRNAFLATYFKRSPRELDP